MHLNIFIVKIKYYFLYFKFYCDFVLLIENFNFLIKLYIEKLLFFINIFVP